MRSLKLTSKKVKRLCTGCMHYKKPCCWWTFNEETSVPYWMVDKLLPRVNVKRASECATFEEIKDFDTSRE